MASSVAAKTAADCQYAGLPAARPTTSGSSASPAAIRQIFRNVCMGSGSLAVSKNRDEEIDRQRRAGQNRDAAVLGGELIDDAGHRSLREGDNVHLCGKLL